MSHIQVLFYKSLATAPQQKCSKMLHALLKRRNKNNYLTKINKYSNHFQNDTLPLAPELRGLVDNCITSHALSELQVFCGRSTF